MRSVEELIDLFGEAEAAAQRYECRHERYGVDSYAFIARQFRRTSREWLSEAIEAQRRFQLALPKV